MASLENNDITFILDLNDDQDSLNSILISRSFTPDLYTTGSSYNSSALPWYADLMHLVFWFFFLTIFAVSLWVVYTFNVLVRCSELRFPIRETRGFSRAQTGDTLTAVIPMCWSITMLMHASAHSSNFDENTDSSSLVFSIIAYQWGWDYSFEVDSFVFKDKQLKGLGSTMSVDSICGFGRRPDFFETNNSLTDNRFYQLHQLILTSMSLKDLECYLCTDDASIVTFFTQTPLSHMRGDEASFFEKIQDSGITSLSNIDSIITSLTLKELFFKRDSSDIWSSSFLRDIRGNHSGLKTTKDCYTQLDFVKSLVRLPSTEGDIDDDFFRDFKTPTLTSTRQSLNFVSDVLLSGGLVHRLAVSSAILLPSDYPLHLVCGSKDVIHSWAIPGLGIKIDCIPGYNCHRRLLLRWRGLFWGQCMEVCGRYHHWMPILLRVTSLDFFVMWLKSIF